MSKNTHKTILVILSHSPYGSSLAREAIDYCLASAAFEQNIQILFTGDAVLQLVENQQPETINQKNISKMLSALPIYGIDELYADQQALTRFSLSEKQLCMPTTLVTPNEMADLLANASHILNF